MLPVVQLTHHVGVEHREMKSLYTPLSKGGIGDVVPVAGKKRAKINTYFGEPDGEEESYKGGR
jgi:hypothetical protein